MMWTLTLTNRITAAVATTCGIIPIRMSSTAKRYEEAVGLLNGLQSNAATIKKMREQRDLMQSMNIPNCREYLNTMGISMKQVNDLNIIHVSGTKGKGSTCAFVEKILRDSGFKTGLYTSPHLVHVRERIRIDGQPIDEETFTDEFFDVFNKIKKNHEDNMPAYFKILTLIAFQIFTKQNIDVAIVEVGIGGEYDCTNVIEKPSVCGVTTLDYDHISILGSKLSEIAWHKAGIFKQNVPAIYSETTDEALEVLQTRAAQKNVNLVEAPSFESYKWPRQISTGIAGSHQLLNVSLALQLVHTWLKVNSKHLDGLSNSWQIGQPFTVPESICDSIESCRWAGRSQVIRTNRNITYLLDGAHTPKSMEACGEWAKQEMDATVKKGVKRILLFQCTADRCPTTLLPFLKKLDVSQIMSCPTQLYASLQQSSDSTNLNISKDEQLEKAKIVVKCWRDSVEGSENISDDQMKTFDCVSSAFDHIETQAKFEELCVVVTGSLHLVGGVLSLIEKHK